MSDQQFEKGLAIRNQVMGKAYTDSVFASPNPIDQDVQRLLTEFGYGMVWSRPGLPLKTRSLITVAILAALNFPDQLRTHVRGAVNLGASDQEILEAVIHVLPYAGAPAMQTALRAAKAAIEEARKAAP